MKKRYPLEQLVEIKKRRLDEAERLLKERREGLKKEKEKQIKLEEVRNKIGQHRADKIQQLRDELDRESSTDKITLMRDYLKVVNAELEQKEKKVQDQIKEVEKAEERVEEARKNMVKKHYDIEKLKIHRTEWSKEIKALTEYEEGLETDEMGTVIHNLRKREGK